MLSNCKSGAELGAGPVNQPISTSMLCQALKTEDFTASKSNEFTDDAQIFFRLPELLMKWRSLTPADIRLQLDSIAQTPQDGHPIRKYQLTLVNDTNQRITEYNGRIWVPRDILSHWSAMYPGEMHSEDLNRRCFPFSEEGRSVVMPRDKVVLYSGDYCSSCAVEKAGGVPIGSALVSEAKITATVWMNGAEYPIEKTLKELATTQP